MTRTIQAAANRAKVTIQQHNVIYHLLDQVKDSMASLLEPESIVSVTGEAEILQLFEITSKKKIEIIAGSRVFSGKVMRNQPCRIIRNGESIHQGSVKTFKHHKKDIMEAGKGLECGLAIENFEDLKVGDIIQSLNITFKKQTI